MTNEGNEFLFGYRRADLQPPAYLAVDLDHAGDVLLLQERELGHRK